MKALVCEMCGSNDLVKQEGVFVCQSCGCKYSVEEAKKMMVEGAVEVTGTVKIIINMTRTKLTTFSRAVSCIRWKSENLFILLCVSHISSTTSCNFF